jgi:hypothetical protein
MMAILDDFLDSFEVCEGAVSLIGGSDMWADCNDGVLVASLRGTLPRLDLGPVLIVFEELSNGILTCGCCTDEVLLVAFGLATVSTSWILASVDAGERISIAEKWAW